MGGRQKVNKMIVALAEASYRKDRRHVGNTMTLTILRDVRKAICAVRFITVDKHMKQHSGLLGAATHLAGFGKVVKGS